MPHTASDLDFILGLPGRDIVAFQKQIAQNFPPDVVGKHPELFYGYDWINVDVLKAFLQRQNESGARVKTEDLDITAIKVEPAASTTVTAVRTRNLNEDGKTVIEILDSDNEDENSPIQNCSAPHISDHVPAAVIEISDSDASGSRGDDHYPLDYHGPSPGYISKRLPSIAPSDIDADGESVTASVWEGRSEPPSAQCSPVRRQPGQPPTRDSETEEEDDLVPLSIDDDCPEVDDSAADPSAEVIVDTEWLSPDIASRIELGPTRITREITSDVVEYITPGKLPHFFPVPRQPTTYIVDLSGESHEYAQLTGKDGQLLPMDSLILDKDQDSWASWTGKSDSRANVFVFGDTALRCRRSRQICKGAFACEQTDKALLDCIRYELDPAELEDVCNAQIQSRLDEVASADHEVIRFYQLVQRKECKNMDAAGEPCGGRPIIRRFKKGSTRGKCTFIGCSNWAPDTKHMAWMIPPEVDEGKLKNLFDGKQLKNIVEASCSRVVSARVGAKLSACHYAHDANGGQSKMKHIKCSVERLIFVPEDATIRKAAVVYRTHKTNRTICGHSHPLLPTTKISKDVKALYEKCVKAVGLVGATVMKVDNSPTTSIIMGGKTPGQVDPALLSGRNKREAIQQLKRVEFPYGTGFEGVQHMYIREASALKLADRYVQSIIPSDTTGGMLIFTFEPRTFARILEVDTLEIDTTFKRINDVYNEWEVVGFHKSSAQTITLARVYTNRATRGQFKATFDELQRLCLLFNGKPLNFRQFTKNGTLTNLGEDMEAAQALGAADSFMPTVDPIHSGIVVTTAEALIPHFITTCHTHAKRAVLDFKGLLDEKDFRRILDFVYLPDEAALTEFNDWIHSLKIKKIIDWWDHKWKSPWILGTLIQCRSKMSAETWARASHTTNISEAQHAWTNKQTGIKLTLLEGILSARTSDRQVADNLHCSKVSGVLKNNTNEASHRLSRRVTRQAHAIKKSTESKADTAAVDAIELQINALLSQKAAITGRAPPKRKAAAESSSSGRVKKKAKTCLPDSVTAILPSSAEPSTSTVGAAAHPNVQPVTGPVILTAEDAFWSELHSMITAPPAAMSTDIQQSMDGLQSTVAAASVDFSSFNFSLNDGMYSENVLLPNGAGTDSSSFMGTDLFGLYST
ncbi:hypothetical protein BDZ89DRAFT_1117241 [Hymenopellis radicata]|nr:hypothetical protein BDZ89DRAFT_1117241 [Hymenopellis radicata]